MQVKDGTAPFYSKPPTANVGGRFIREYDVMTVKDQL